jgi:hypothetical protein
VEREALRVSEKPRAEESEESKETSAAAAATPSDKQHVAYEDSQVK